MVRVQIVAGFGVCALLFLITNNKKSSNKSVTLLFCLGPATGYQTPHVVCDDRAVYAKLLSLAKIMSNFLSFFGRKAKKEDTK